MHRVIEVRLQNLLDFLKHPITVDAPPQGLGTTGGATGAAPGNHSQGGGHSSSASSDSDVLDRLIPWSSILFSRLCGCMRASYAMSNIASAAGGDDVDVTGEAVTATAASSTNNNSSNTTSNSNNYVDNTGSGPAQNNPLARKKEAPLFGGKSN